MSETNDQRIYDRCIIRVGQLEAENESLREELDAAKHDLSIFSGRIVELDAENAKLSELVRHMHTCIEHYEPDGSVGCEHCPLNNDTGNCDYERRMLDLGVEVDDA